MIISEREFPLHLMIKATFLDIIYVADVIIRICFLDG